jgi:hypothetical protein
MSFIALPVALAAVGGPVDRRCPSPIQSKRIYAKTMYRGPSYIPCQVAVSPRTVDSGVQSDDGGRMRTLEVSLAPPHGRVPSMGPRPLSVRELARASVGSTPLVADSCCGAHPKAGPPVGGVRAMTGAVATSTSWSGRPGSRGAPSERRDHCGRRDARWSAGAPVFGLGSGTPGAGRTSSGAGGVSAGSGGRRDHRAAPGGCRAASGRIAAVTHIDRSARVPGIPTASDQAGMLAWPPTPTSGAGTSNGRYDEFGPRLEALEAMCVEIGRDPATIAGRRGSSSTHVSHGGRGSRRRSRSAAIADGIRSFRDGKLHPWSRV